MNANALVAECQPEAAIFEILDTKIPLEVIKRAMVWRKLYLIKPYIVLTRHPNFSGHLSKCKLSQFSDILGQSQSASWRQLKALKELGLLIEHSTVWMAVGADYFASLSGYSKCKFVKYHHNIRELAFAAIISEQLLRIVFSKKKGRGKQTQDHGVGFNVNLSSSYTRNYLISIGIEYSTQEISKLRNRAKKLGMLDYWRKRELMEMTSVEFHAQKKYGEVEAGVFAQRNQVVVKEAPSVFSGCLHVYSRGISNKLKRNARSIRSKVYGK